ncbi:YbfB/YjiJ family MFS transporter [Kurthia sp. FSL E2-0154]|uniref:YbfB/YjiJ family MFS transporter n=1 Tax=Kurthia sp. FSL E2-0154 TaxID=2921358 RepID=UPI0030F6A0DF
MNRKHLSIMIGAIFFLTIAMGIGRFSFTSVLPFLRESENLSVQTGSVIAAGNYIGYLVGAFAAGWIVKYQKSILGLNVFLCILSVFFMGVTDQVSMWFSLRIVSGITGGIIFVLTSSMLMDYLAKYQLGKWSGYTFSGIGLGIAISGLVVPLFVSYGNWRIAYFGLTAIAAFCMVITFILWRNLRAEPHIKSPKSDKVLRGFMVWLTIAYGLEGLGYIITGTFLVDLVHSIPSIQQYAGFSWVIVGLGAIPSAPLWIWLMTTYKPTTILSIAYIIQIVAVILPVLTTNIWTVLLSALLFGSTFVGLVAMSTSYGRQLFPKKSASVVSILTTSYAIGQIIGPIAAGILVKQYGSYNAALVLASIIILFALILLRVGLLFQKSPATQAVESTSLE